MSDGYETKKGKITYVDCMGRVIVLMETDEAAVLFCGPAVVVERNLVQGHEVLLKRMSGHRRMTDWVFA